ncbi:MAG: ribonuclease HII [Lachnospiraceae bacterium]|nr:ribonuclease HII [Lachnospiraceae bacterium]
METRISLIKELFSKSPEDELDGLIEEYSSDGRDSVKKIIQSAQTRIAKLKAERARLEVMKFFEHKYGECELICGIDEAGRGPLAGPVCAGAVILKKDVEILYLNDSKKLSAKKRDELFDKIKELSLAYSVGLSDNKRIDEINILNATYEAMRKAIAGLGKRPDILLNDYVKIPDIDIRQIPITHGDAQSVSIAAASIMAKVTRDRIMDEYEKEYPGYGFSQNKGYGTQQHIDAIRQMGLTPIHRLSFVGNLI